MDATIIESCTCTMFCPCYFATVPSGHSHGSMTEHYCRFNMGHRVNKGNFRGVSLDGVKFWIAGDLGADFSKGAEWAEIRALAAPVFASADAAEGRAAFAEKRTPRWTGR